MIFPFLLKAVIISLSGVMAPGPITAITVSKGAENPKSGAMIAIGHGVVEFPLMILIVVGFGRFFELNWVKVVIGILGGLFLLNMALGLLKNVRDFKIGSLDQKYSPFQSGIVLTIANPYFLIWWATIGAVLITGAYQFGLFGFIAFAIVHWSCDFIWYSFLSSLSFKGGQFFGKRMQKVLFIFCGVFLLFFSGKFIYDAMLIVF
ncbi:MAG: LysE family transporter [Candidatus Atribacteria bacterium]|nr:LysE family transporter [Candidatus Atribacteria bacterium]